MRLLGLRQDQIVFHSLLCKHFVKAAEELSLKHGINAEIINPNPKQTNNSVTIIP